MVSRDGMGFEPANHNAAGWFLTPAAERLLL